MFQTKPLEGKPATFSQKKTYICNAGAACAHVLCFCSVKLVCCIPQIQHYSLFLFQFLLWELQFSILVGW